MISSSPRKLLIVPYHSVDCCVERLPLCPEYREDKGVEASPYEAHKGPTQPEIAVWVNLDLRGVNMFGAKTKTHMSINQNQQMHQHLFAESSFPISEVSLVVNKIQKITSLRNVM